VNTIVFPAPGSPNTRMTRPRVNPPPSISSRPGIPVSVLSILVKRNMRPVTRNVLCVSIENKVQENG